MGKEPEPKNHQFVLHHFRSPRWCNFCKGFIWGAIGKQGYKCEVCNYSVHKACLAKAEPCFGVPMKKEEIKKSLANSLKMGSVSSVSSGCEENAPLNFTSIGSDRIEKKTGDSYDITSESEDEEQHVPGLDGGYTFYDFDDSDPFLE